MQKVFFCLNISNLKPIFCFPFILSDITEPYLLYFFNSTIYLCNMKCLYHFYFAKKHRTPCISSVLILLLSLFHSALHFICKSESVGLYQGWPVRRSIMTSYLVDRFCFGMNLNCISLRSKVKQILELKVKFEIYTKWRPFEILKIFLQRQKVKNFEPDSISKGILFFREHLFLGLHFCSDRLRVFIKF